MLRRRHLHFPIGQREHDEWLLGMRMAMAETIADEALRDLPYRALEPIAAHMMNQGAHAGDGDCRHSSAETDELHRIRQKRLGHL